MAESEKQIAEAARFFAPVVWLLGKVQSGKTSIINALTGAAADEIGSGFKAKTSTSRIFDYPSEAPVIRFLDTRGLGETGYDPSEDLAVCERQAHLILVVMKALDHDQAGVMNVITRVRRRHGDWPLVVAQTSLHEGYPPGVGHLLPYPFAIGQGEAKDEGGLPPDLRRSLARQRRMFDAVPGDGAVVFVPLDFTRKEDGFCPVDYGLDALLEAFRQVAPNALVASLEEMHGASRDSTARRANPHVIGYAMAAAAADVVPLAGLVAVPGIQAKMLHSLGHIYGVSWDRRRFGQFAAALGAGTITRNLSIFGLRELAKLIPGYGQTAGAAAAAVASFATTFALGKAACYFLGRGGTGANDRASVASTYKDALGEALRIATQRDVSKVAAPGKT